jgi:hypothetical protein
MVLVEPIFLFKGILKLSESDFQQSGFFWFEQIWF